MKKLILLLLAALTLGCNEDVSDEIKETEIIGTELSKKSTQTSKENISSIDVQSIVDAINNDVTAEWIKDKKYEDVVVYGLPSINGLETCYTFLISNPIDGHLYYKNYLMKPGETSGGFLCSNEDGSRNLYNISKKERNSVPSGENDIRLYTVSIPSTGEAAYLYGHKSIKFIKP